MVVDSGLSGLSAFCITRRSSRDVILAAAASFVTQYRVALGAHPFVGGLGMLSAIVGSVWLSMSMSLVANSEASSSLLTMEGVFAIRITVLTFWVVQAADLMAHRAALSWIEMGVLRRSNQFESLHLCSQVLP